MHDGVFEDQVWSSPVWNLWINQDRLKWVWVGNNLKVLVGRIKAWLLGDSYDSLECVHYHSHSEKSLHSCK
jgi:hypothetical protein